MAKTEYEKELEKQPYSTLVYMCEGKRVLHTGDKDDLIARLVEAHQAEPEAEPEAPPEAPEVTAAEPEKASAETEATEPEKGPPEAEATEPRPPGRRRSPPKT